MHFHTMAIKREFESKLDQGLAELKCFEGAVEKMVSPLLPMRFILASKYVSSFPQHAFTVSNRMQAGEDFLLSPTCCYPIFHTMQSSRLEGNTLITHKNQCFRCEKYYVEGERQISFLMREYIFFSDDLNTVQRWVSDVKSDVRLMLVNLGLEVDIERATDPFFNSDDFRLKFQESQELKSEFLINGVACGSVNLHLKAFSRSCDIKTQDGEDLYSACFGLGYDRVYQQYLNISNAS